MKNNRQVGLDGKVFLTSCLKRGSIYVFGLLLYGAVSAFADILKLLGKSGEAMSALTSTLVTFDMILSLMLIVVVFYAYFLECGASIPVLRDKPIIILGYCRLGYNVLLCYYIVYRAMYCLANRQTVPFATLAFYLCYMVVTFLSILACCFVLNILQRNMIRRVFMRSFRTLAVCGIIFSSLVPVMYIVSRFFMKEIGDEYFTDALCDMLRLCIAPLIYVCLWVTFLRARIVTAEVFGEVDNAIRDRRYQITYTEKTDELAPVKENKRLAEKKAKAASAAATVAAIEASLGEKAKQAALPAKSEEKPKEKSAEKTEEKPEKTEEAKPETEAPEEKKEEKKPEEPIGPKKENLPDQNRIKDEKLRQAVSEAVAKVIAENEEAAPVNNIPQSPVNEPKKPAMPVMDFNPFEQAERAQAASQANQKPNAPQMPKRPVQPQRQPQRPMQPGQPRAPQHVQHPAQRVNPQQGQHTSHVTPVQQRPNQRPGSGNQNPRNH